MRVIQWATGSMGRTALRRIIDAQELTLAGTYVYGSGKAGVDAGTLARRADTGVLATDDRAAILALGRDVGWSNGHFTRRSRRCRVRGAGSAPRSLALRACGAQRA